MDLFSLFDKQVHKVAWYSIHEIYEIPPRKWGVVLFS